MSFITTLDKEKKLLAIKSKGEIDIQRIDSIRTEIKSLLDGTEGWDLLINHSESTMKNLDYHQMNSVTNKSKVALDALKLRRFVLVVNTNDYGHGRMWEILMSDKMSADTHAFKTIEQANQFLEESE
ncbi:hypothetical protein Ga0123461_1312 [Mariprofundus aestuarium]|uniref:SpoIIAA-like n=2 Tax=Mariprofundus aestuarium TaxID=1921086 RepID=A0A2K8L0K1_MARES|nr:hypothetical protein Ga0123461_1312 [Mariprofundus aestuarium]